MKKNNLYIITILLCLGFNVLGSFQCFCNNPKEENDEDDEIYIEEEKPKSPINEQASAEVDAEVEAKATQEEEKKEKTLRREKKNSMKVGRSTCLHTDPTVITSKMAIHFLSR